MSEPQIFTVLNEQRKPVDSGTLSDLQDEPGLAREAWHRESTQLSDTLKRINNLKEAILGLPRSWARLEEGEEAAANRFSLWRDLWYLLSRIGKLRDFFRFVREYHVGPPDSLTSFVQKVDPNHPIAWLYEVMRFEDQMHRFGGLFEGEEREQFNRLRRGLSQDRVRAALFFDDGRPMDIMSVYRRAQELRYFVYDYMGRAATEEARRGLRAGIPTLREPPP